MDMEDAMKVEPTARTMVAVAVGGTCGALSLAIAGALLGTMAGASLGAGVGSLGALFTGGRLVSFGAILGSGAGCIVGALAGSYSGLLGGRCLGFYCEQTAKQACVQGSIHRQLWTSPIYRNFPVLVLMADSGLFIAASVFWSFLRLTGRLGPCVVRCPGHMIFMSPFVFWALQAYVLLWGAFFLKASRKKRLVNIGLITAMLWGGIELVADIFIIAQVSTNDASCAKKVAYTDFALTALGLLANRLGLLVYNRERERRGLAKQYSSRENLLS